MVSSNAVVLCTYSYDPLDRLAGASPGGSDSVQRFYQKSRLTTEIRGEIHRALFQTEDHLLAQQQHQSGKTNCALFGTDRQRSVLHGLDATQQLAFAYAPYGFHQPQLHLPGFTGEQPDPVTGHYLLGNGYRAFNPVLMRFNSPDSLSPFGKGGLNAYAYCVGDPVNRVDPTGHTWGWVKALARLVGRSKTIQNVKPLFGKYDGIYLFKEKSFGKSVLTIAGDSSQSNYYHQYHSLVTNSGVKISPRQLHDAVQATGVNIHQFSGVRLLMSGGASGGSGSYASRFSAISNAPVKAYVGNIATAGRPTLSLEFERLRNAIPAQFFYKKGYQIAKSNPFRPGSEAYDKFNYGPVKFIRGQPQSR